MRELHAFIDRIAVLVPIEVEAGLHE